MQLSIPPSKLPQPTQAAIHHSLKLTAHIHEICQAHQGIISFAHFMSLALYAPNLGYYCSNTPKFGPRGDFITAPEISTLFVETLANQCSEILSLLPKPFYLLELGAGSGRLAAILIPALKRLKLMPEKYFILEVSPNLIKRQQLFLEKNCPKDFSRIEWLPQFLDHEFSGIILANEVLDALPVQRFCITQNPDEIQEVAVHSHNEMFSWVKRPASKKLSAAIQTLQNNLEPNRLAPGYISEICLKLENFIHQTSKALKQGACIILDYGYPREEYYHPQRNLGTLMCYYRHLAHTDPFLHIGLQDITAHVDFSYLADLAYRASFEVASYETQANFLIKNGLLGLAEAAIQQGTNPIVLSQEIQKLILPNEMGELFKCMILKKEPSP
ncbi:MAG TPA: SAM-dependent methyltransferase [Gammaproteobacteria bacterium]|nr:SAM-dependent methyltransferase [Gammaproteobacteria bacterium]